MFGLIGSTAAGAEPVRVTFAELAACPIVEDVSDPRLADGMPEGLRRAVESRVRCTGYMLPLDLEQGRTRQFLLLRNQNACCFGLMPAANEFLVAVVSGAAVSVQMDRPVTIEGRLRIAPVTSDGVVVQLFNLEESTVVAPAG